ncbi:hypothetical protein [Agrobacterium sp. LMR679]|uniref:hypothetical protein n=1 Tax=Agrobacterium sp. LMR679 TaxID=3014335 RepID=UPI0022AE5929|nr:hypothetical protein [Agrobacterium sp. LMR679]MCZ4072795.1 hypothetical protein [Agrobacterium sp. LMR679]
MTSKSAFIHNRPAAVIAIVLFAIAAVTYWDASRMVVRATYGMSATAASYFVAILFAILAAGHLVSAFKPNDVENEEVDWKAVGWIGLALSGLIVSIWAGAGSFWGRRCFSPSPRAPSAARRSSPIFVLGRSSASSSSFFSTSF